MIHHCNYVRMNDLQNASQYCLHVVPNPSCLVQMCLQFTICLKTSALNSLNVNTHGMLSFAGDENSRTYKKIWAFPSKFLLVQRKYESLKVKY